LAALPLGGDRVGRLVAQRAVAGQAAGVLDRGGGRVVAEALGDRAAVGEQAQEAAAVAAGVEHAPAREVDVDRRQHRLPDEAVLVLHRLVMGRAAPVRGGHATFVTTSAAAAP
jgi:hypothetical protein